MKIVDIGRSFVKRTARRLAPHFYVAISAVRSRYHAQRLEAQWGLVDHTHLLVETYGAAVMSGPFKNIRYPPRSLLRHSGPKLLGTYECEVYAFLELAISALPNVVIDIGCAEGYYAVGLAKRLPAAKVYAFDIDPWARRRTREMAMLNNVQNLEVAGECMRDWLISHAQGSAFIVMDCEGCEAHLAANAVTDLKASSWWMIELHELASPGVTERLRSFFASTHRVELITSRPRHRGDAPAVVAMNDSSQVMAWMQEHRDAGQQWLVCSPIDS